MKSRFLLLALILLICSCRRKQGCIDRLASNYDAGARKEGVCFYEGRFVLWADQANIDKYKGEMLLYYINGNLVKSDSGMKPASGNPECDAPEGLTFKHDMGTNTTQNISYRIARSSNAQVITDSSLTLRAGYCVPQKVIFR